MITACIGRKKITDLVELKTKLSGSIESDNFGLFLGAGASVPEGGKVMGQLWNEFHRKNKNSVNWMQKERFFSNHGSQVAQNATSPQDVETLIDKLIIAIEDRERDNGDGKLNKIKSERDKLLRSIINAAILKCSLWNQPAIKNSHSGSLIHHKKVIKKIMDSRKRINLPPWIFTTNYDLIIEWTAQSLGVPIINGFSTGVARRFAPHRFFETFEDSMPLNLVKLHGSFLWEIQNEIAYQIDEADAFQSLIKYLRGGDKLLNFLILPGSSKYIKTTGFVCGELFRQFYQFLTKNKSKLIVVGYGFGDLHINLQIKSALVQNGDLELIIYYPEFDGLTNISNLPSSLIDILDSGNKRVTIIGGDKNAYFDKFSDHLV